MRRSDVSIDTLIASLAERWAEEIREGKAVSVEQVKHDYPQLADLAEPLLATLQVMCESDTLGLNTVPDIATDSMTSDRQAQLTEPDLDVMEGRTVRPVPKRLGHYQLVRQIGRGGMGLVFEARHVELDRRVALKVLFNPATEDSVAEQRFRNESRAAAHLDHPNIVSVFDSGIEQGWHYFAMHLVEGFNLAQIISATGSSGAVGDQTADRALEQELAETRQFTDSAIGEYGSSKWWQRASEIAVQVARAVHHAHGRGFIHRDIKPSNLIIDGDGNCWVTDFGLAWSDTNTTLTNTGDLLGTIRYMSPEQISAGGKPLDHRTDIYSLGVTLFELLTLQPAVVGQRHAALLEQLRVPIIRSPRRVCREVPKDLDAIVAKACAFDPEDRYATADQMADDLKRFMDGDRVIAKRSGIGRWLSHIARRHRVALIWIACFASILSLVTTTAVFRIEQERRRAVAGEQLAREAENEQSQARQEADRLRLLSDQALWKASLAEADLRLLDHSPGRRERSLQSIHVASDLIPRINASPRQRARLRDLALATLCMEDLVHRQSLPLAKHSHQIEAAAFQGDYQHFVEHRQQQLVIRDRLSSQEKGSIDLVDFPLACWFSPDGARLAVVGEQAAEDGTERRTLRLFDWKSAALLEHLGFEQMDADVQRMAMDFRDSSQLAVGFSDQTVGLLSLDADRTSRIDPGARLEVPGKPHSLCFSPDARWLAVCCLSANRVAVIDLQRWEIVDIIELESTAYGIAWHPSEDQLAIGSSFQLQLWARGPTGWRETQRFVSQHAPVHEVFYHPSGRLLATHGYDGRSRLWVPGRREPLLELDGHVCRFDQTGRRIAVRGPEHVDLFDVQFESFVWSPLDVQVPDAPTFHLTFLLGGRLLVLEAGHQFLVFDVEQRQQVARVDCPGFVDWWIPADASSPDRSASAIQPQQAELWWSDTDDLHQLIFRRATAVDRTPISGTSDESWSIVPGKTVQVPDDIEPHCFAFDLEDRATLFVACENSHAIFRLQLDHRDRQRLADGIRPVNIAQHPDGQWLAMGNYNQSDFFLLSSEDGHILRLDTRRTGQARFYSLDGKLRLVTGSPDAYRVWDPQTQQVLKSFPRADAVGKPIFDAELGGSLLVMQSQPDRVELIDPRSFELLAQLTLPRGRRGITGMALSTDPYRIAIAADHQVFVFELQALSAALAQWSEFGQDLQRCLTRPRRSTILTAP